VLLARTINARWLTTGTLVPVPPSKAADDPLYDDRMLQICRGIPGADVRELVQQRATIRSASKSAGNRPAFDELLANYMINEAACAPVPTQIAVVDDVLTAGSHFRAMHAALSARFPGVPIAGIFIARRALANDPTDAHP
jgi:predicted amidophosphoribosyltransferase